VQLLAAQQTPRGEAWFQGTADAVRQNLDIILESRGELVLILSGDHMYRMDYRRLMHEHLESGADVTVAALPCAEDEIGGVRAIRVDDAGRIVEFREKPKDEAARAGMRAGADCSPAAAWARRGRTCASMGIYLFDKAFLRDVPAEPLSTTTSAATSCRTRSRREGPVLPLRGVLARHRNDPGVLRRAHGSRERRSAVSLQRPDWPFYTHPRYLPGAA
jgi:glucose-1-phosphate adenylyltransferase